METHFYIALNHTYERSNSRLSLTNALFVTYDLSLNHFLALNYSVDLPSRQTLTQSFTLTSSIPYAGLAPGLRLSYSRKVSPNVSFSLTLSYAQWPIKVSFSVTQTVVLTNEITMTLTCSLSGPLIGHHSHPRLSLEAVRDRSVPHTTFK
ncbi:hypothetical protein M8J77_015536 [Diaphorina citri]|nr:hypothetical protein M8J77_015536 [Diaphorina citri]